ncbi:hypothetical protein MLD38_021966 [Melastoma candidum]|uniref:Uncharacterized protein n=1 Tax=Melastoma candidum TaxID=119954 RepID=A0ACB9QHM9_9MYRT|nr:hypothetical protein MLD38_021966 [Melastoma candidum]
MSHILRFWSAFLVLLLLASCTGAARMRLLRPLTEQESRSAMMEIAKQVLNSHMQIQKEMGRQWRSPVSNRISPSGPDPQHH